MIENLAPLVREMEKCKDIPLILLKKIDERVHSLNIGIS